MFGAIHRQARRASGRSRRPTRAASASGSSAAAAASGRGSGAERRQDAHRDASEPLDRRAVGRSIASGSAGQGVITTAGDREPGGAGRLDGQQRVVDRSQPRAGGDHQRQRRGRARGRGRRPGGKRDEQPADALDDKRRVRAARVAPAACRRAARRRRRPRRRAPRRDGARPAGPKRPGRHRLGLLTACAAPAARGPVAIPGSGSSSPVTTGLHADDRPARRAQRAQIAAATTVFPTPVSVAVTKQPRIRPRSRRGGARLPVDACPRAGSGTSPRTCVRLGAAAAIGTPAPGRNPAFSAARPRTWAASRSSALRVRGHDREAQARGALRDGRRTDRLREHAALDARARRSASPARRRRRSAGRSGSSSRRPRSPRGPARRAARRRWPGASRRGAAARRAAPARPARRRRRAAAGAVEKISVRAVLTR